MGVDLRIPPESGLVEGLICVRSFGASSAHKGMWRAQEMAPDTPNHALTMWDVDGELDTDVIAAAFQHVMGEAEVLRVNFTDDGGGLRMAPRDLGDWQPFFLDLSAEDDPEQAAREAMADLVRRPFDLSRDLLFRLGVVTLAPNRSLLVIAYHHLISDGFGAGGLLSKRLAEVYTALAGGHQAPPLPHPWDVASFAGEATQYLDSDTFTQDSEFWRTYLTDAPPPAQVPRVALSDTQRTELSEPLGSADRWSEVAETIGMVSRTLSVPRAEAEVWTKTAQSMGLWMSQLLSAATAVFLRHRCDRPHFLLSLAVGNRVGVASRTPGLAVNVVPVRAHVDLNSTFAEVADALVEETYDISGHTACHYSDIQRAAGTPLSGRGSYGAVVNVVEFVEQLHFGDSPARYSGATTGTFEELSIGVYTDGSADSDLFIRLDAPARLYHRAELRHVGEELIAFIRAAVAAPDAPVGALDVLEGPAREQVLPARRPAPATDWSTVPELFARQAAGRPDAPALTCGERTLTYRELDEHSTRTARELTARLTGEKVVALALPRSADLAIALLGVAKAGAAYLPLDPDAPAEQLSAQLRQSPASVLLTDAAHTAHLAAQLDLPVLAAADLAWSATDTTPAAGPAVRPPRPDSLLAVLPAATNHGTDHPAVAVSHRNMSHFVQDPHWQGAGDSTVLWHTPPTHDALALEVWLPLLSGGHVVTHPDAGLDADALAAAAAAHALTTLWLPAVQFATIAAQRPDSLAALREVWTGGDRVSAAALRRVKAACPDLTVVHGHGLREATVFAGCHRLAADEPVRHAGTVGRPLDDTALYVLGPGLAPVPVGVSGELYVAGPGVAPGYPGRPALTAQRFVPCPFGPPGTLMHRTGDRARRGTGGRLEYVARAGEQGEVRGVAVELPEVEEVLSEHTAVAYAVAGFRKDATGAQRLAAYVVPAPGHSVAADELRRFAAGWLPESLVPSVFTVLDTLPVGADGRVQRAALPQPAFDEGTYRAPRNDTERVLAAAFADVLERERVGIDEDFFDLGGNSLRAIRLVGLIRTELKQEVSIRRLFAARTVIGLSDMWKDLGQSSRPSLRRRTKQGAVL
ncbi:AMP-binding protein [Streptomyces sp. NPDC002952]|uniref:AMP-binding protein n=1 Tax=Streptomyces sp. NPDC002952 TaxID=3364673 RepID=UPI0036C2C7DC